MDSSEIPAGKPPSGVVPNFVNPPTNAVIIRATAITGAVLVVCFVTVRVLTNMQSPRKLGWDDCEFRHTVKYRYEYSDKETKYAALLRRSLLLPGQHSFVQVCLRIVA